MLTIFIRIILVYAMLIISIRVMGKRQLGELQISELVTTFMLSELVTQPVSDDSIPLLFAVIPTVTLLSMEVMISYLVTKIPVLKHFFDGKPSMIIIDGELVTKEIKKVRISLEELLGQLRLTGISEISDVKYAILEQNGQLSVIPKKSTAPPSCEDLKLHPPETGIAHAVIVDGKISDYDLKFIKKDREWLMSRLEEYNIPLKKVFLFTVNDGGGERLIKK